MSFTSAELAHLATQRLGRPATVQPNDTLQVSPVGFRYNGITGTIDTSPARAPGRRIGIPLTR
jgi:pyridoxamine 5'-phosphate oxidase family protein